MLVANPGLVTVGGRGVTHMSPCLLRASVSVFPSVRLCSPRRPLYACLSAPSICPASPGHAGVTGNLGIGRFGLSGCVVRRIDEVVLRRARLDPGRVTVFGRVHHLDM